MNPLDWLQDNIFYTDAKKKEINDAAYKNNRQVPSMMTPGQTYGDASYSQQQKTDAINSGVKSAIGLDKKPSQVMGPGGPGGFGMGNSSNPVRPSQPAGEPTAYAQHAGTTYYQLPDGRDVYQTSDGSTYDRATGQQVAISKTTGESGVHDGAFSRKGKGFSAYEGTNLRNEDNQVIEKGTQVWKVPDSTLNTGGGGGNRDNSRVIPGSGGKVQKGTDMGRSFNDLLATTNTSGYQPFSSNQLPTTAGSPDANIGPVTDGVAYADMLQNAPNAGTKGIGPLANGDAYAKAVEGNGKSTSRLDAALNDKAGISSYMSKFSSGAQERAANRAFLDTEGSMQGLRAKEAVNGVVYAQGKHYVSGKSGDDQAVAIDRSAARDISNGKETSAGASQKAQDFLINKKAEVTAAAKQEPTTLESAASSQAFKQDKPMSTTMPGDNGVSVEFDSNNDNAIKPFGNNSGYKSGFKRIDTSVTIPFSK